MRLRLDMDMDATVEDQVQLRTIPSELIVRQKRRHTKSRSGCVTCKLRRVKCDETLPHCRVCSSRGLHCEYAAVPVKQERRSESPSQCSIRLSTQCTTTTTNKSTHKNAPDALLWQYYLAHASKTIVASSTDPAHAHMWQDSVPAIAFSSAVVSHAMMAFSAFCLGTAACRDNGERARGFRATAESHYYRSVRLLRNSLAVVDCSSADAVLACAMVLIPCGLALARSDKGVFELRDWLCHLRGWRVIGSSFYGDGAGSEGRKGTTERLIPYPQPGIPESREPLSSRLVGGERLSTWTSTGPFMAILQRSWPDAVAKLKRAVESYDDTTTDPANTTIYTSAVASLEDVVDYILSHPVPNLFRAIFVWPIRILPEFVRLLECNDGLALAIYAHWLVLTMAVEDLWWLRGFGSGQIDRLVSRASSVSGLKAELVVWPVTMLEGWRKIGRDG